MYSPQPAGRLPVKAVMMRRYLVPAVLGFALVACQDQAPRAGRTIVPARYAISQGPHFFFLPPLAPAPSPTGTFNGNLFPVIEICTLTGPNGTCTGALVGSFTRTAGTHNQLITVVPNSHYQLDWNTDFDQLPERTWARITVRSASGGGTVFGFVDVLLSMDAGDQDDAGNAQTVWIENGTVVPIKFIMEDGILCQNDTDCFEGTIDAAGGTFTFPDGSAGVQAPAGAVAPGEAANLIIERFHGPDLCLPTDFPQYEACLRVRVEGNITLPLAIPVDVGFCLEAGAPDVAELEIQKWDEVNPSTLVTLTTTDVSDFITCAPALGSADQPQGQLARLAHATGRLLHSLVAIKPAYAASTVAPGPIPFGAGMSDFSRVGVVRPLKLEKVSGDNSAGAAGSTVTPTVKVTAKNNGAPVAGVHIVFTPTAGTGTANPVDAFTDLAGLASTTWTIGLGANTLRADAFNPRVGFPNNPTPTLWGSALFNATGVDLSTLKALFLPPIGKTNANLAKQVHNLPATVTICRLNASNVCTAETYGPFTAIDDGLKYQTSWNTPRNLTIGAIFRITVSVSGTPLTSSAIDIQPIAGGKAKNLTAGTTFSFQVGSNQPLKFSIETP